jgi:two-component system chemotaxis sensor kinase CheA
MDEMLAQFLIEGRELVAQAEDDLAALAADPNDRSRLDGAFRAFHTLKGSVALFDMAPAGRVLHLAEDLLDTARAEGRTLDPAAGSSLTAVLDQVDRWIDAMETPGTIGPDAGAIAERLIDLLRAGEGGLPTGEAPVWLGPLLERHAGTVDPGTDLVAFRYRPDAECFFRGDDPLAIVAGLPDLVALDIVPLTPWPALAELEPYHCAVTIEGLSSAGVADVQAAFRFVADEAEVLAVPGRQADAMVETTAVSQQSLRIDVARIDTLASGVGELVVAANAFTHVAVAADKVDPQIAASIRAAQTDLDRAVAAMRRGVLAVRSVSLGPSLRRLPRMVRELGATLGKSVVFEMSGEATEVDKGIADALFEPLLHLVRNAVDHGIEPEGIRRAAGKPPAGTIRLRIRPDGDQVLIELTDDGAGIDAARLRERAVSKGLLDRTAADALEDAQALRLIFAPGFSTASEITAVSGRGVGMDAVRIAVEQLGGRIEIASVVGDGTTVRLRLPLNAIMTRLLVVRVGDDRYGVVLDRISETVSVTAESIVAIGAGRACVLRDRTLPVLSLATMLGGAENPARSAKLLVTDAAGEPVGVMVDGFGERIDGLVRPRAGLLAGVPGIAGTTMLGDGGVLIVLDLAELVA